jgi:hypothetical protein
MNQRPTGGFDGAPCNSGRRRWRRHWLTSVFALRLLCAWWLCGLPAALPAQQGSTCHLARHMLMAAAGGTVRLVAWPNWRLPAAAGADDRLHMAVTGAALGGHRLRYAACGLPFCCSPAAQATGAGKGQTRHPARWPLVGVVQVLASGSRWFGAGTCRGGRAAPGAHSLCWPVFALVLVEQVFRNVATEDSRWNQARCAWAWPASSLFDLYLFSEPCFCSIARWTPTPAALRGAVHALMVPLLLLLRARGAATGLSKIQVSRKAAFHSATLILAGALPAVHVGIGLLRALLWWRMGARAAIGPGGRGPGLPGGWWCRVLCALAEGVCGQALLQLPLRLPRRVAAIHGHAVLQARRKKWAA